MSVTRIRSGLPCSLKASPPPVGSTKTVLPPHFRTNVACWIGTTTRSPLSVLIVSCARARRAATKRLFMVFSLQNLDTTSSGGRLYRNCFLNRRHEIEAHNVLSIDSVNELFGTLLERA